MDNDNVNSIKFWRDGDRFIIVVDNCTGETATKVNQFIVGLIGLDNGNPPEAQTIPHITPKPPVSLNKEKVLSKAVPITGPRDLFKDTVDPYNVNIEGGAGTLGHAIESKDTASVVRVHAKSADPEIRRLCKEYILKDCEGRDYVLADEAEIRVFFTDYAPIIQDATNQILSSAGYSSLADFFDFATPALIRDAYRAILESILKK